MDCEKYYDSLDEDSNYGSLESLDSIDNQPKTIPNPSNISVKTGIWPCQREGEGNSTEEDDIIPFYDQNLSKSEIELKRNCAAEGQKNKPQKKFSRKKVAVPKIQAKLRTNSYLDLFYAKIGVEKIDLSNRATCSDTTPKSYVTCEDLDPASSLCLSEVERYKTRNTSALLNNNFLASTAPKMLKTRKCYHYL